MDSTDPLLTFRWRLAETIAWCRLSGYFADPVNSLRTPQLRPKCMIDEPTYGYEWGGYEERQATMYRLSEKRAELLRKLGKYPSAPTQSVSKGRLLLNDPDNSDICCLSEWDSRGFIDPYDLPPWDTWFWYSEEEVTCNQEVLLRVPKG